MTWNYKHHGPPTASCLQNLTLQHQLTSTLEGCGLQCALRVSKSVPLPCVVVNCVYIVGLVTTGHNDVNGPDGPDMPEICA